MIPKRFKRLGTRIVYCLIICIGFTACSANAVKPDPVSSGPKDRTDEEGKLSFSKAVKIARVTGATPEGEILPNSQQDR